MYRLAISAALFIAAASIASAADQPIPYSLDYCFISDDALSEFGKPIVFVYKGHEIKVCCKDCKKMFDKNKDKALARLQELSAKNTSAASN